MTAASAIAAFRERPHVLLALIGVTIVAVTSIVASGFHPLSLPFLAWGAAPYALLWLSGRVLRTSGPLVGAGSAAVAAELGIRASVFIWPRGSTAALALLFSPPLIAVVIMPAGAALGWLCGVLWRRHAAGRVIVAVTAPITLALLALGFARPELFPTRVLQRRAVLARIGPPRVVVGAQRFEAAMLSTRSGWHLVAEIDGEAGEEIAVVDHEGAEIFDSTTLAATRQLRFGGERGRAWGSFSTLVRRPDGQVAIADTGGGFSRTLLKDLDGKTLWEYKPDPTLATDAMRPMDAEGDGEAEFYASSPRAVARLDSSGREVWNRPSALANIIAALPRRGEVPAWVVALEYGCRVLVFDSGGALLAERPVTAEDSPRTAIDSFAGRVIVHGGEVARGYDLGAQKRFEISLGEFRLSQAAGARLAKGQAPSVVLVGSTDRDIRRSRLLVVDPARRVVYDEIFEDLPRVLVAARADGSDVVLISQRSSLRLLRAKR
jgi:hypothetical protein